jgi:TolB-like protein
MFSLNASADDKTNIAVSDLAGQGIDAASAAMISDRLRGELFNTGTVAVIERSQMKEILKEQGFQQTGCTSDQCAVEVGQLLGVKYMVVGAIGLVGHTYSISGRLIDVSTGKMVANSNIDCKCEIDDVLSRSTVEMARKLVQSFASAQNIPPSKPVEIVKPAPPAVETGTLKVTSNPAGASLFINDSAKGITPVKLDSLKSGPYQLTIALQGYTPLTDNVRVYAGGTEEKNYHLKPIPAAVAQPAAGVKKSNPAPKIVFGLIAGAAGGIGIFLDNMFAAKLSEIDNKKQAFAALGSDDSQYAVYSNDIHDKAKQARNLQTIRNTSYIIAGLGAVGFAVSFAF